jgi:type IV secretory pathway component VirB8
MNQWGEQSEKEEEKNKSTRKWRSKRRGKCTYEIGEMISLAWILMTASAIAVIQLITIA